jgi:alpha-1,3-mannosyltransferase
MEKIKILQIARQFFPSIGGIESVTLGLSKALKEVGYDCAVATLKYNFQSKEKLDSFEEVEGVPVYRFSHIGGRRYPIVPEVLKLVKDYDLLHIHAIDFFVDFINLTRFLHNKPIVVSTHGGIFHTRWNRIIKRIWFRTLTRASLGGVRWVVADSQHDMDLFRPIVLPGKLKYIPNGVDIENLLILPRLTERGLLVGVGRMVENKRVDMILQAIAQLRLEFPYIHLVWVGSGSEEESLKKQAADLGLNENVQFMGLIPTPQRNSLLARAHLFVSAASYEAFGVSTIEALAAGAVPVVTRVGIHPEVIQTGQNGWLYSGGIDSLTETLRQALKTDMDQISIMSELSRKKAQPYSWKSIVAEYVKLYENALSG